MKQFSGLHGMSYTNVTALFTAIIFACLGAQAALAGTNDHFVTTWKTDNAGTSNTSSITVPMVGGPYDVDWDNDEDFDEFGLNGSVTHDYGGLGGTVTIRIQGSYDSIRFNFGGDQLKILSIDQWGTQSWTSMNSAFAGAENLQVPAIDTPDFSMVSDMSSMFSSTTLANPDTSGWNMSSVTNMSFMFNSATSANPDTSAWNTAAVTNISGVFRLAPLADPDTSGWNTAAVTDMSFMFQGATTATPDTSGWNTAAVTNMSFMFVGASVANPDTSAWNTAAVTNMTSMFSSAPLANPNTSGWDTSSVTNMSSMFNLATSANPDISAWDTSAVTNMSSMFSSATSFDQDIGSWDVTSLINAISMFTGVTLSTANYESLLVGWNAQALNMGVAFDGGNSTYCSDAATLARANMIATFNWTITDGGQDCPPQPTHYFVTTWKTDNPGTSDQFSITVPMIGDLYDVDWNNDGIFDEFGLSGPVTHNFGVVDTYTIRIKGFYDSIRFNNDGDRLKILSIDQWGTQSWTSMNAAFWGAANLVVPATDTPDFSAVEDMTAMFTNATSANPDTSGWDTSAVTSMALMFRSASAANPDVSGWDTSEVITMGFMFQFASSFDQDIGSWDVTSLTTATGMLTGAALSTTNYDSLLIGWDAQALNMGVTFSGGNSVYCSAPAVAARANMIASDGWVITDGGQCVPDEIFASSFEAGE